VTPKKKDEFPDKQDRTYVYLPKPMDDIPPISEHEFYKRFYACKRPKVSHWYHRCKKFSRHSREVLNLLPKRVGALEEGGDKREIFWGIYAREIVSLRWILLYNVLCALPMFVFLFLWLFKLGQKGDLQNAATPLSMMLGFLSIFWSVFLSSLNFGKSYTEA
jgi:hypothetical protein